MISNKKELISIVVPVYNGEKYICSCVNSLLSQNYENIEIIIVNDGSKDETKQIIHDNYDKYSNIIIIDKDNTGVSDSRNVGIKIAKGKYITFVDADDTVEKEYIGYLYSLLSMNNSQIALTRYPNKVTEKSLTLKTTVVKDYVEILTGIQAAVEMLYYKIVISSWNKMYDLSFLISNDIFFDSSLSYGEGFEFVIKCFLKSQKVAIGNLQYYNYRVDNENSVMTTYKPKLVYGSMDAQKEIAKEISQINSRELQNAQRYAYWHTCYDCLNTIVGCNVIRENYKLYKQLKKICRSGAKCAFNIHVSLKEKMKAVLFFINPYFASKTINKFRIRRFTKKEQEGELK